MDNTGTDVVGRSPSVLLDTDDVAALLGLRPNTLAQWRVSGAGPTYLKVGRRVRYRVADVDAWLASHARRSTCDTGVGATGVVVPPTGKNRKASAVSHR
jgi:predicted DNA-binding transcriptional regulator AlpA